MWKKEIYKEKSKGTYIALVQTDSMSDPLLIPPQRHVTQSSLDIPTDQNQIAYPKVTTTTSSPVTCPTVIWYKRMSQLVFYVKRITCVNAEGLHWA